MADTKRIVDMVLTVGWIEGKLDVLASLSDGKIRQELVVAKGNLGNLADDLIEMIEGNE